MVSSTGTMLDASGSPAVGRSCGVWQLDWLTSHPFFMEVGSAVQLSVMVSSNEKCGVTTTWPSLASHILIVCLAGVASRLTYLSPRCELLAFGSTFRGHVGVGSAAVDRNVCKAGLLVSSLS